MDGAREGDANCQMLSTGEILHKREWTGKSSHPLGGCGGRDANSASSRWALGSPLGREVKQPFFSTAENTANELDLEPNCGAGCSSVGGSCFQTCLPSITARSPVAA